MNQAPRYLEMFDVPPFDWKLDLLLEAEQRSKNTPTDPWNIPQTPDQRFMKEFLSFGVLGIPGVCSKSILGFS